MSASFSSFLYLVSAICFILALKGLSSAKTSRAGNMYGMVGMAIAILTTILSPSVASYSYILLGLVVGGGVGFVIAKKIQMTALPQLVAGFHSFVGLAAVFVAAAALLSPASFGIGIEGAVHTSSLIEMGLGSAIGAITFSGSLVAFGKLQGLIGFKPFSRAFLVIFLICRSVKETKLAISLLVIFRLKTITMNV
jgi:NAD(P) transhydrogenase subunit beta